MTAQSIVLCVMLIEAFVVLIRQDSHLRITRALRPIVFIDSHYVYGVRRCELITLLHNLKYPKTNYYYCSGFWLQSYIAGSS